MRRIFQIGSSLTLASACFMGGNDVTNPPPPPGDDAGVVQPFQADPPSVYVAKVKDILTGLPPTQVEIDQVAGASDPRAALVALIDAWMKTPEYTSKITRFFALAFEQTQIAGIDFVPQVPRGQNLGVNNTLVNMLVQNASESMARTMIELIAQGKPLSAAMTTHTFMMTPPLMELYGYLDASQPDDDDKVTDSFAKAHPHLTIALEDTDAVPISQTLDPQSPNYMRWYYPGLKAAQPNQPGCQLDERDFDASSAVLHLLQYGSIGTFFIGGTRCSQFAGDGSTSYFQPADFATWKMVTIRPPAQGEQTTPFWDANALKGTTELVLGTPRVGFFTTPAFGANWQTNTSNSMRVTLNQALIVATGAQIDGTDATPLPPNPPGVDSVHAGSPDCYGCHQYLDTTRSILQATYSDNYGTQTDPQWTGTKGWFAFQGVVDQNIASIDDLAKNLASHPKLASAWVQKLCYFANSAPCAPDDPEFQRIVSAFQTNGLSWPKLVEDLLSSPITTNASESQTASEQGEVVSIARLDHLCTLLDARLGLVDVCGLDAVKQVKDGVPVIAAGLPSDGYGRGAPVPVLPTQPTLFFRAGAENICETIAALVVDDATPPPGAVTYSSKAQPDVDAAIADFVSTLMALEASDSRASQASALLASHYQAARTDAEHPASPTDALRSTFTVACLSPSVLGIGM